MQVVPPALEKLILDLSRLPGIGRKTATRLAIHIMRQAQDFQQRLSQVQNELAGRVVTASVGGGMVSVTVNGKNEVLSIQIDKEVINPEDQVMLQDLIVSAVNEGIKKAQDIAQAEMRKLTGGINIPGLF